MIRSMTGFGRSINETPGKKITLELKSLNSKQFDISIRMPSLYSEKEPEMRNIASKHLERGKVFLNVYVEYTGEESPFGVNYNLAQSYFKQLADLESQLNLQPNENYLQVLMRMPDVLKAKHEVIDKEEWKIIKQGLLDAAADLNSFRDHEGEILEEDIVKRIAIIKELTKEIEPLEKLRIGKVRERLLKELKEIKDNVKFDNERLEQEMIFYLEKLDITEEMVRLDTHCTYFMEVMGGKDNAGKKLGFIAQEIGREINTIGSKANDANLQKVVVNMKDELEKIKEQLMNVL